MPPDTITSIEAEIAALKDKISKAEDQQAFTSGGPGLARISSGVTSGACMRACCAWRSAGIVSMMP